MKDKLTFITASAGTGKTFRLIRELRDAVLGGEVRPEAVIATTFTRAAADEMRERLSAAFYRERRYDEAARLENDALISTVHGICFRLLNRFAFEAGIAPDLRVLNESEAKLLLDTAIDEVVDESVRQEIYALASRLGQRNWKLAWTWRGQVKEILETARSNDLTRGELPAMAEASWAEMEAGLGTEVEEGLGDALLVKVREFLEESEGTTVKTTQDYRDLLEAFVSRIDSPNFPWSNWEKLGRSMPAKNPKPLYEKAEEIASLAGRVGNHPGLRRDLRAYLVLLFDLAGRAGGRFEELKRKRGAADYTDLEKATLDLLRKNGTVRGILGAEIDLLLVDEFQDTTPIQLALFAELGHFARRVIWVGDVKQSIYRFRGADPELVFRASRGAAVEHSLETSWRSVPDLVEAVNRHFAPAFREALGLPEDKTRIVAHRVDPSSGKPALEIAEISTGEFYKNGNPFPLRGKKWSVMADAVADLLERDGEEVIEKGSIGVAEPRGTARPLEPGDVAILVRRRENAAALAEKLRLRGYEVSHVGSGLLSTPEAGFALACLRRWLDRADSLAAAEIVAFEGLRETEEWLEDRLACLDEREGGEYAEPWLPDFSPALQGIHRAAEADRRKDFRSPLDAFDRAVEAAGAARIISRWGPGETRTTQRLANLEQLRRFIGDYESRARTFGIPATFSGLFGWLSDLGESGEDTFPETPAGGAVTVSTYHGAKGLEWPVVFLADLDSAPQGTLFSLRVKRAGSDPFDFDDPLKGRELRLWVNPFGGSAGSGQSRVHPLVESLVGSDTGREAESAEKEEALRLLYVGFTRARDRLVLIHEPASNPLWLEELGESAADALLGRGEEGAALRREYRFDPAGDLPGEAASSTIAVVPGADGATARKPALLVPSSAGPREGAEIVRCHEFGRRLSLTGSPDERDLGDAVHRILAAEVLSSGLGDGEREERILGFLEGFGLEDQLSPGDVRESVDRFLRFVEDEFHPESVEVEVPFSIRNAAGQEVTGFIDFLVTLVSGERLIIDHKTFPGRESDWEAKALGYSGQLEVYAEALGGAIPPRTFIHFFTGGGLVEVSLPSRSSS